MLVFISKPSRTTRRVGRVWESSTRRRWRPHGSTTTSILALLHAHAYLLNHLNDFFVSGCWGDVPPEWRPFLLSLSADGLAALAPHPVPDAPASLVRFVALAASLALPRTPSQEEEARLCWAAASPRLVSLSVTLC